MRLDLFLKASRLVPRRSAAQELCSQGLVSINGHSARSSKEIKPGDEIEIKRRNRITRVKINTVPDKKQVSRSDAGELYELIEEIPVADETI